MINSVNDPKKLKLPRRKKPEHEKPGSMFDYRDVSEGNALRFARESVVSGMSYEEAASLWGVWIFMIPVTSWF